MSPVCALHTVQLLGCKLRDSDGSNIGKGQQRCKYNKMSAKIIVEQRAGSVAKCKHMAIWLNSKLVITSMKKNPPYSGSTKKSELYKNIIITSISPILKRQKCFAFTCNFDFSKA